MDKSIASPLVSVLMCVYNAEKYLSASIESILNQTYRNFELIIIDDGSTDKSLEIIKSYKDNRIRVYSRENKGISVTRNEAISKAKGKYIAWQDADDISLPQRLAYQLKYLEKNYNVGILGSNYDVIDEKGVVINRTDVFTEPSDLKLAMIVFNDIGQGTVMLRKEIIKELGGYDSGFKLGEDYDLWTRAMHVTDIANLKTSLYKWRYHQSSSWTNSKDEMRKYAYYVRDREFNHYLHHKKFFKLQSLHPFSTIGGPKKYCEKKSMIFRNLSLLYRNRGSKVKTCLMLFFAILLAPWHKKNYIFAKTLFLNRNPKSLEYEGI